MSGRIRTIKPELLEDAITAGLSDSAFRVFIGMILVADDYGNLRAEVGYLEGQIYWKAIPEKSVEESCKELESPYGDSPETLVSFYSIRGQRYAHLNGWEKHQRVQHPGKPRVPARQMRISGESHETLTKVPESLAPDLRPPTSDHDPEQKGAREGLAPTPAPPAPVRQEPESQTRIKSAPPAPPDDPPRSAGQVAIALQIRQHALFRGIDAHALAPTLEFRAELANRKLEWLLQAIDDCAAKFVGQGLKPEAIQAKLVSFCDHASAPREAQAPPGESKGGAAYREDDDAETIARLRRGPRRLTAQDAPAALGAIAAGGKGQR